MEQTRVLHPKVMIAVFSIPAKCPLQAVLTDSCIGLFPDSILAFPRLLFNGDQSKASDAVGDVSILSRQRQLAGARCS
jgi:hypothetical protein